MSLFDNYANKSSRFLYFPIPQEISFQLTGDLALRGVTRSVVFDVELTLIDAEQLEGVATTNVNRRDFGILNNNDNAFDYHGVADEITLKFEFEAQAVWE